MTDINDFLNEIKATGDDVKSVKALPTEEKELEELIPECGKTTFQTFHAWLKSKVGEDIEFLHSNIDETFSEKVKIYYGPTFLTNLKSTIFSSGNVK